jgi:hypothetical protein
MNNAEEEETVSTYLVPIIVARPFSCSAEANTSAALAVPPFVRMAMGTRESE